MPELKPGIDTQEGLSFYCDRDITYYKQFVRNGQLDTEKLATAGFNERQIPQIRVIAEEQGWLGQSVAVPIPQAIAFDQEDE